MVFELGGIGEILIAILYLDAAILFFHFIPHSRAP